jgi:pullulanase
MRTGLPVLTAVTVLRCVLAALGLAGVGMAWAAPAACDGPHETLLRAAPGLPPPWADARAAWLDAQRLRWAAVPGEGRFRLLHSNSGQLVLAPGKVARGIDTALVLDRLPGQPESEPALRRFSHIGPGATLAVRAADRKRLAELHRGQIMLVREDASALVLDATAVQVAGALDALYPAAAAVPDLGAVPRAGGTQFKLWAPTARQVALCLYPSGQAAASSMRLLQRDAATGVWAGRLPADLAGRYYAFAVELFVRGRGMVRNLVTDPYSLSLSTDSRRSYVADLGAPGLEPEGWRDAPTPQRVSAPTDLVIYELHVRDFSANDRSVSAPHRGKYLAFTEGGSKGMQHLKAIAQAGVTDVHLLPAFDFAGVPEAGCTTPEVPPAAPDSEAQQAAVMAGAATDCYNWGYDPWHYGAPEGSYASDAGDGAVRIREFRAMVAALHRAGLRVGMDLVYNHTTASGQNPRSVLDRIVPGYYHRLDAKGEVERSTCCDNTATEQAMMAKLMIDSTVVWARHYRVDSFRFDLMGHQPREAMERLQRAVNAATGRRIDLIGEGWNFGEVKDSARFVQAAQGRLDGSGIASFSDRARDAARGGGCCDNGPETQQHQGWLNGLFYDPNAQALAQGAGTRADLLHAADLVRVGLAGTLRDYRMQAQDGRVKTLAEIDYAGQPAGYASQPGEVVNYVENHDGRTLFDIGVLKLPAGTRREDRARVQVLGLALTAFSQGLAYVHAGVELMRSKSGDRDSVDSGDWFNRLDWTATEHLWGSGLPPQAPNGDLWPVLKPLLADPAIKPTAADIRTTRDAFLDLLRIRASSVLFRLRTADDVKRRLVFFNTGPDQIGSLVVGHLDGTGLAGANFRELVYLINADPQPQVLTVEALKGHPFELHPVLRAPQAADPRVREARFDSDSGRFSIPARCAVVFVVN